SQVGSRRSAVAGRQSAVAGSPVGSRRSAVAGSPVGSRRVASRQSPVGRRQSTVAGGSWRLSCRRSAGWNPRRSRDARGFCLIGVSDYDMTFQETAASLPNGFHDAELRRFEMDYVRRQLQFDLVIWIGDMDAPGRRELYRRARLRVDDVAFLVVEPPDVSY